MSDHHHDVTVAGVVAGGVASTLASSLEHFAFTVLSGAASALLVHAVRVVLKRWGPRK